MPIEAMKRWRDYLHYSEFTIQRDLSGNYKDTLFRSACVVGDCRFISEPLTRERATINAITKHLITVH